MPQDELPKTAAQPSNSEPQNERAVSLVDGFTWGNFTCTQSTGGVALMLSKTPYSFRGLHTIGVVVFILNLVVFILFCTAMIYGAITLTYNVVIFVVMFSLAPFAPGSMSSPMFLMIYNAMLTGTVASAIAADQPPSQRIPIIVAGIAFEGLGWILCLLFLPHFVGNLLVNGLGPVNLRPGLFISVGSAGYTIIALIGCAKAIPDGHGYFAKHPTAAETLNIMALWVGIFLWLFTFWLFAIAAVAHVPILVSKLRGDKSRQQMSFALPWWAIVFPNVGFTIATVYIGEELESSAISWVATVMTILVFIAWLMDMYLHMKSIFQKRIM
ncbi:C4-dicarboxylate transport mae1 [Fusarium circinatum]|uniref:C4-dicarboxylate transport mae1 n=1 Tax=Fusarium circinatum TaxID=48490 RepID=A0A8H5SVW5_FUSCI|nr:C4-dicarboxylate transport mae1 [Fusarium circinatum]